MMRVCVQCFMQNDFCLPNAVLCVKGAMGCLPKVVEAVGVARARGIPVVWVIREHDPEGKGIGQRGRTMRSGKLACLCTVVSVGQG